MTFIMNFPAFCLIICGMYGLLDIQLHWGYIGVNESPHKDSMNTRKIAEMLRGVARMAQHDHVNQTWSQEGQPHADYWKNASWYTGREQDQQDLDALKSYGQVDVSPKEGHATFKYENFLVWYSDRWGWGVEIDGREMYRSRDNNYTAADIPAIPLAMARGKSVGSAK